MSENIVVNNVDFEKQKELAIVENKQLRKELDDVLQKLKVVSQPQYQNWPANSCRPSRNRELAITHLEDAIMRLGMDLKELGTPNPYPNSYNPNNTIVDKTADGLKL